MSESEQEDWSILTFLKWVYQANRKHDWGRIASAVITFYVGILLLIDYISSRLKRDND